MSDVVKSILYISQHVIREALLSKEIFNMCVIRLKHLPTTLLDVVRLYLAIVRSVAYNGRCRYSLLTKQECEHGIYVCKRSR